MIGENVIALSLLLFILETLEQIENVLFKRGLKKFIGGGNSLICFHCFNLSRKSLVGK